MVSTYGHKNDDKGVVSHIKCLHALVLNKEYLFPFISLILLFNHRFEYHATAEKGTEN